MRLALRLITALSVGFAALLVSAAFVLVGQQLLTGGVDFGVAGAAGWVIAAAATVFAWLRLGSAFGAKESADRDDEMTSWFGRQPE